jgi:hypothetical protein
MSIVSRRAGRPFPKAHLQVECLEERSVPAVVDLTTPGATGAINSATFLQANPQPTGVGVINDFLRIQSHGDSVEQGYNSDVRPTQFDEKTDRNFTRSIHLSELPTVSVNGVVYRVILLGVNQKQSQPLISLDELRLYVSDSSQVSGYDPTTKQLGGLTAVYDMGDNWVELNSSLSHGNGSGDMFLFVPDSLLASPTGNPDPYIYLYSKMGVHFGANSGFEQWAPAPLAARASLSGFVYFDANQDRHELPGPVGHDGDHHGSQRLVPLWRPAARHLPDHRNAAGGIGIPGLQGQSRHRQRPAGWHGAQQHHVGEHPAAAGSSRHQLRLRQHRPVHRQLNSP